MKTLKLLTILSILLMISGQVLAAQGGKPAAHEFENGKDFGAAVSAAAKDGGIGDHASDGKGGGKPAAHGVSGKMFGEGTSGLAQSYPGAVKDHKDNPPTVEE